LFWTERPDLHTGWNTKYADKEAFTCNSYGYFWGRINAKLYAAHRVCWAIHFGEWPKMDIDHVNGNRGDNRITNLRDVSRGENMRNKRVCPRNKSGLFGVSWCKQTETWRATIGVNGKQIHIGRFLKKEDAFDARQDALVKYNFHKNHGV
jgi:hypothetical protein